MNVFLIVFFVDRGARKEYGDDAVGYVQLKRTGNICTVKGKITPEHRVHNKPYNVTVQIDENEEKIMSSECHDCTASHGNLN